jgi:hypothetical protein
MSPLLNAFLPNMTSKKAGYRFKSDPLSVRPTGVNVPHNCQASYWIAASPALGCAMMPGRRLSFNR